MGKDDRIEGFIGKGQVPDIPLPQFESPAAMFQELMSLGQHGIGNINAGDMSGLINTFQKRQTEGSCSDSTVEDMECRVKMT